MAISNLATANTKAVKAAQAQQLRAAQAQQLGMANPGVLGYGQAMQPGFGVDPGAGIPAGVSGQGKTPQVNATNQSALAPNGTVNQEVSNANTYEHKFYNIFQGGGGAYPLGAGGAFGGVLGGFGGGCGQCGGGYDPYSGAAYCQPQRGGIIGWIQKLFRGY